MICENSPANNGSHIGTVSSYQNESRRNNWTYKIDEIDDAVLSELPAEIQEEVNVWIRPQKRANISKKGSSISHYFLPAREK